MTMHTLTIIKPDAFATGKAGKILAHLEDNGFRIVAARPADSALLLRRSPFGLPQGGAEFNRLDSQG